MIIIVRKSTGFFGTSFLFAVIHRFVSVYLLSYFSNRLYRRARVIRPNEQFLMAYGGLRGAIAFSLAFSMPPFLEHRQLLTSSTLHLVVASVFLFGCTMKPLVRYLKIRSDTTPELSLLECMNRRVQLYTLAGIENLIGQKSFNAYAERYVRLNELKLRPMLVNSSAMHNQLAVELRFMLEQLYVKHTNPHTDMPPPPHAPGIAVRMFGHNLFERVRRLSSLRRSSGSSDRSKADDRKRRLTDEAIALQRSHQDDDTLCAITGRTRRSAGDSPLFCTPIRMPLPPPPRLVPPSPAIARSDRSTNGSKRYEHRVQIDKINRSASQTSKHRSNNQLTVPGSFVPNTVPTDATIDDETDDASMCSSWKSQILHIPVLDEATGVWLTNGQRRSLESSSIGVQVMPVHSEHHGRRASLQATNAANERQLVHARLSYLEPAGPRHANSRSIDHADDRSMVARYRRTSRTLSEERTRQLQRQLLVNSQSSINHRSKRKPKTSQYSVYSHHDWQTIQRSDRLTSITNPHDRPESTEFPTNSKI
jgi:hypothetical protein